MDQDYGEYLLVDKAATRGEEHTAIQILKAQTRKGSVTSPL